MELMVSVDLARSWFGPSSGSIDGLHSRDDVSSFCLIKAQLKAQPGVSNWSIRRSNSCRRRKSCRETSLGGVSLNPSSPSLCIRSRQGRWRST